MLQLDKFRDSCQNLSIEPLTHSLSPFVGFSSGQSFITLGKHGLGKRNTYLRIDLYIVEGYELHLIG